MFDYIERFYNRASEHPSGYVIEVKRFCSAGGDPAGYLGFCRARAVMDWAASVARAVRASLAVGLGLATLLLEGRCDWLERPAFAPDRFDHASLAHEIGNKISVSELIWPFFSETWMWP